MIFKEPIFRPVLILGAGVQGCRKEAVEFVEKLGIPVALTWGALDLLPTDHPLNVGGFGTHGTRYANFTVQNADFILSVGSRLDTKATGSPASSFAPKARVVMVDIDRTEIEKFEKLGRKVEGIVSDARIFFVNQPAHRIACPEWLGQIEVWKKKYPACLPEYREEKLNPYAFVDLLSEYVKPDDILTVDVGCSIAWVCQAFRFSGQRLIASWNHAPMGHALSAAIGASLATGKRAIAVMGDASIQMNVSELATIVKHKLPVKIIVFDNNGHGMIRQTQDQWLNGEYVASSEDGGLAHSDIVHIAEAYGIWTNSVYDLLYAKSDLGWLLGDDQPALLHVLIDEKYGVVPQVRAGRPNEDSDPLLPRDEFNAQMI